MRDPIPHRMPSLIWRRPAFVWTPIALAAAISWPAVLFQDDPSVQRVILMGQFATFALALAAFGVSWGLGRAPRTRRTATLYVVWASAVTALAGPFVTGLMVGRDGASGFGPLAAAPLAAVLGLPIALGSGLVFAWLAFVRRPTDDDVADTPIDSYEPFG